MGKETEAVTILEARSLPDRVGQAAAEVLLARIDWRDSGRTEFVTWQRNRDSGAKYWGHYFRTAKAAEADFRARLRGALS